MFRLECFVDDAKVPKVLWALNGLVMNLSVVPVINAKAENGKVKAVASGSAIEMFANWITERGLKTVNAASAREFLESIGRAPGSSSYVLKQASDMGIIKRIPGKNGVNIEYRVSKRAAAYSDSTVQK